MVNPERDEESGQYADKYPREDFIEAIEAEGGLASTTDIAERVGCDRSVAYRKLREMAADGLIQKKEIGNSLAWLVAGDEQGRGNE